MAPHDLELSRTPLCRSQELSPFIPEENQCRVIDSNNTTVGRGSGDSFLNAIGMRGASSAPASQAPAARLNASATSLSVETIHYENGFTVYLDQNPHAKDVYAELVVRGGSKNDPIKFPGLAHYFEHMMFKGTDQIGTTNYSAELPPMQQIENYYEQLTHLDPNKPSDQPERQKIQKEISRLSTEVSKLLTISPLDVLYSSIGLQYWGAQTLRDYTRYDFRLPSDSTVIEKWARVLPEISSKNVFRLFQPEITVVVEEWERAMSSPRYVLEDKTLQLLFPNHPYGRTVLGEIKNLQNPSLKSMQEFYEKYYVPHRMALVISGNFDPQKTKEVLQKYLASIPKKEFTSTDAPQTLPEIKGVVQGDVNRRGEEAVSIAFRIPPVQSKDYPALLMLHRLLDGQQGNFGKLDEVLVGPKKIARGRASFKFFEEAGMFRLEGSPLKDQPLKDVTPLLLEELEKIKRGEGISQKELQAVAYSFEQETKKGLEDSQFRGELLTQAYGYNASPDYAIRAISKIKKLTPADIERVAKKYFQGNYVVVYRHNKVDENPVKLEKPEVGRLIYSVTPETATSFTQAVLSMPGTSSPLSPIKYGGKEGDFQVISIAPGVVLYHSINPQNDLGTLSISYNYGDSIQDRQFCVVMNERNEASLHEGIKVISPAELKKKFNALAINSTQNCAEGSFELQLTGPDKSLEEALKLSEQLLWKPQIDPAHFKASIKRINQQRDLEPSDPSVVSRALTDYVLLREKSPYRDRSTQDELNALGATDAQTAYDLRTEQLSKQNFTVYYTGTLSIAEVTRLIKKHHSPSKIQTPLLASGIQKAPAQYLPTSDSTPVQIYFTPYEDQQAKGFVRLVIPEEVQTGDSKRVASYRLLNAFLGHNYQGDGFMWQIFRDKKGGLAYTPDARYIPGDRLGDHGRFEMTIETQSEKIPDVFETALELFRKFPLTPEEFKIKKDLLKATIRFEKPGFRELFPTIRQWTKWGYLADPTPSWIQAIDQLSYDDFKGYVQEVLQSRRFTFTVVTDPRRMSPKTLEKFGVVKEIKPELLFKN